MRRRHELVVRREQVEHRATAEREAAYAASSRPRGGPRAPPPGSPGRRTREGVEAEGSPPDGDDRRGPEGPDRPGPARHAEPRTGSPPMAPAADRTRAAARSASSAAAAPARRRHHETNRRRPEGYARRGSAERARITAKDRGGLGGHRHARVDRDERSRARHRVAALKTRGARAIAHRPPLGRGGLVVCGRTHGARDRAVTRSRSGGAARRRSGANPPMSYTAHRPVIST